MYIIIMLQIVRLHESITILVVVDNVLPGSPFKLSFWFSLGNGKSDSLSHVLYHEDGCNYK